MNDSNLKTLDIPDLNNINFKNCYLKERLEDNDFPINKAFISKIIHYSKDNLQILNFDSKKKESVVYLTYKNIELTATRTRFTEAAEITIDNEEVLQYYYEDEEKIISEFSTKKDDDYVEIVRLLLDEEFDKVLKKIREI